MHTYSHILNKLHKIKYILSYHPVCSKLQVMEDEVLKCKVKANRLADLLEK